MSKGSVHIGTSGWHYKHWNGTFYPETVRAVDRFEYYTTMFQTVEINNSFYRLPNKNVFTGWRKAAPKGFTYAVKASRFITHMKKLNVDPDSISNFFDNVACLKEKLGPILFQLPPNWKINMGRLEQFLKNLPAGHIYTIEFRNTTWYTEEVYTILEKYNVAFCIYELDGHISPVITTAGFVYARLHGPGAKYQGSYAKDVLNKWAKKIRSWTRKGKDVFFYFDNDQEGYAAINAKTLQEIVYNKKKF
ncbi:DUF72 domain-containing protein [Flavitalea sp.]|nr:DUF72 domain-containing protein [Flavitalea sp.]